MNIFDELVARGLIAQCSNEEEVRKLLEKPTTIYCGFDPSASSMHLGNFVMISLLMRLQQAGHRIIALVGGATGMIGDPSGKSKERNLQNSETLKANTLSIKKQLERFLDLSDPERGLILNNYDWIGSLSVLDFLRDYGKYFSVNYMLAKEIVASRLESGISFTEFSYQILQSLDFLHLYDEYGCHLQIGGNDQWGNLTSGLELIRKKKGEDAACEVFTAKLITRSDGRKFGKSEEGALFLDPKLTSPYRLYQYLLNTADDDALRYLKIFTFLPLEKIEEISLEHLKNPGARLAQKTLAHEVTKTIHGEEKTLEAERMSVALFTNQVSSLSEEGIEEVLGSLRKVVSLGLPLVDLLVNVGVAPSKTQARTFILGGSISVNDQKTFDPSHVYGKDEALYGKYLVIKRGKKNYYLAVIAE